MIKLSFFFMKPGEYYQVKSNVQIQKNKIYMYKTKN